MWYGAVAYIYMGLLTFFNRFQKILIVEDDKHLRSTLAEMFRSRGYKVVEAGSAHEALGLVGSERPSLLLLDLILPMKDGISLLEELRGTGFTQPTIILSNLLGSGELGRDAERLNATFFNKSKTSLDEIVKAVEARLRIAK